MRENYDVISEWIESFDEKTLASVDDPMKAFLMYEEYVMRKASQEFDLTDRANDDKVQEFYLRNMSEFMDKFHLEYRQREDGFDVVFEGQTFNADFQKDKLEKITKEMGE